MIQVRFIKTMWSVFMIKMKNHDFIQKRMTSPKILGWLIEDQISARWATAKRPRWVMAWQIESWAKNSGELGPDWAFLNLIFEWSGQDWTMLNLTSYAFENWVGRRGWGYVSWLHLPPASIPLMSHIFNCQCILQLVKKQLLMNQTFKWFNLLFCMI